MRTEPTPTRSAAHTLLTLSAVRYVLAGAGLFALDTAVFLTLHVGLGVGLRWSQLCSRTVGASAGFVVHRGWTFARGEGTRSAKDQGPAYVAVMIFNICASPFVVDGASHLFPWSLVVAKVAAEVLLVTETYLLFRWVFRAPTRSEP